MSNEKLKPLIAFVCICLVVGCIVTAYTSRHSEVSSPSDDTTGNAAHSKSADANPAANLGKKVNSAKKNADLGKKFRKVKTDTPSVSKAAQNSAGPVRSGTKPVSMEKKRSKQQGIN